MRPGPAQPSAAAGSPSAGTAPTGVGEEVRVVATEFAFEPPTIELPAGRPVTLVLENRGQAAHDLHVPALGIHLVAPPYRTARFAVTADRPGRYDALCTLPGHEQLGMRGAVVVAGR